MSDSLGTVDCADVRRFWNWQHANSDADPLAGNSLSLGYGCVGDVCVTLDDGSGPMPLIEGTDYTVDVDTGVISFVTGGATSFFKSDTTVVTAWFNVKVCPADKPCIDAPCCEGGNDPFTGYATVRPPNCVPVPVVIFSPVGGTPQLYPLTVSLSANRSDVSIFYTLNGTIPTAGSTLYTGAFVIADPSVVITAIAIVTGCDFGPVSIAQYLSPAIPLPDIWLKADAITGKNDGDDVDVWTDSSGNGHDGIWFEGPIPLQNHAIYNTNIQNALPAVLFGAIVGMCTGWTRNSGSPFTVFVACRLNDLTVTNRRIITAGCDGSGKNFLIGPYQGSWQLYNSDFIVGAAIDTNNHILSATQKTGETNFYVDGTLAGTNVPVQWFGIMGIGNTAINEDILGYVFEIMGWERILTADERASVENALKLKWGI